MNKKPNYITKIKEKTKKPIIYIIFSFIINKIKYNITLEEYTIFEIYNLTNEEKELLITKNENQKLIKKLNSSKENIFLSRVEFNHKYTKYLNRNWLLLTKDNYNEFKTFVKENPLIVLKTDDKSLNIKPEIVDTKNKNLYNIFTSSGTSNIPLVEQPITQNESLSKLNPTSYNSINIITINKKILTAYIMIGNQTKTNLIEENALIAPINIETGIVDYLASSIDGQAYEKHPLTKEEILWYKVPKWPRIKRYVESLAKETNQNYVSWNITLNLKDPVLISATDKPNYLLYGLPGYKEHNLQLKSRIEKLIKENE